MEKNRYNLEEVMPRLSLLSQVLEELDIENELIVSLEREPEILAVLEERKVRIQAEMTEGHKALMVMRCEIELPETGVGNMELMCQRFNQKSLFGTAAWEPIKNQIIFRSIVLEPDLETEEAYFKFVLELFSESLGMFEESLRRTEAEG